MYIPLGVVFWLLPRWWMALFPLDVGSAMPCILSILYGCNIGLIIGELLDVASPHGRLILGIAGIVIVQVVCSLIVNFISGFYDR